AGRGLKSGRHYQIFETHYGSEDKPVSVIGGLCIVLPQIFDYPYKTRRTCRKAQRIILKQKQNTFA
ncbi:hypothetical protein, partial [Pontibacter sp. HJ8]